MQLHVHLGSRTIDVALPWADAKKTEFVEEEHPRGEAGKFAKKGEVSSNIGGEMSKFGFKSQPGPDALYGNPTGHTIMVKAPPEGAKYSNAWVHQAPGKTFATHGKGGVHLIHHLSKILGQPTQPMSSGSPEHQAAVASVKAPPSFEHPSPGYQANIVNFGFKPIKESGDTQVYQDPTGGTLKVKKTSLKSGKYSWSYTPTIFDTPQSGKGRWELTLKLHQAHPGLPVTPPKALGNGIESNGNVFVGDHYEPARVYEAKDGKKFKLSATTNAWAVYEPGPYASEKTLAMGYGQTSFNAAFEQLHPRGPGGQFKAVPGTGGFQNELAKLGGWLPSKLDADNWVFKDALGNQLWIDKETNDWGIYKVDTSSGKPESLPSQNGSNLASLHQALSGSAAPHTETKPPEKLPEAKPKIALGTLTKVGPQLGSNQGAQYQDPTTGKKFYVKKTPSADHARNELLAAALYQLAGAGTLQYRESDDDHAVVTEMESLAANNLNQLNSTQKAQAKQDFAIHAWLANWDAVGASGDNLGASQPGGKPINLDLGGSLAYRAKGSPKGNAFGNTATEWDTLRSPSKNPQSAALFGAMTPIELKASAARLKPLVGKTGEFQQLAMKQGYSAVDGYALAMKLEARLKDVLSRANNTGTTTPSPAFKPPFSYSEGGPSVSQLNQAAAPGIPTASLGTASQRASTMTYTGGGYGAINRALRYGFHSGNHVEAEKIKNITAWLDQASMPEDAVCTRRVSSDYAKFLLEVATVGSEYTDFGFCSTSRTGRWSGEVTCMVKIPKGSKAASVQSISHHASEDEVLVQRGSKFHVVDYDPKTKTIYVILDQKHLVKTEEL